MRLKKEYANIYLVSGIISACVIFYAITLVTTYKGITSGSSAQTAQEKLLKK